MSDQITLTIPREPGFDGVAHLVLSGLAVRLNLTIENLEDLQVALDSLLDPTDRDGELTVVVQLRDGELVARIGPISTRVLNELDEEKGGELGRRGVLDSSVDDVLVDGEWVELTKKVAVVHG